MEMFVKQMKLKNYLIILSHEYTKELIKLMPKIESLIYKFLIQSADDFQIPYY